MIEFNILRKSPLQLSKCTSIQVAHFPYLMYSSPNLRGTAIGTIILYRSLVLTWAPPLNTTLQLAVPRMDLSPITPSRSTTEHALSNHIPIRKTLLHVVEHGIFEQKRLLHVCCSGPPIITSQMWGLRLVQQE